MFEPTPIDPAIATKLMIIYFGMGALAVLIFYLLTSSLKIRLATKIVCMAGIAGVAFGGWKYHLDHHQQQKIADYEEGLTRREALRRKSSEGYRRSQKERTQQQLEAHRKEQERMAPIIAQRERERKERRLEEKKNRQQVYEEHFKTWTAELKKGVPPFTFVGTCEDDWRCSVAVKSSGIDARKDLELVTYERVVADGHDSSANYTDNSKVKLGEWGKEYREIEVLTDRKDLGSFPPQKFSTQRSIYSWVDDGYYEVERFQDGERVIARSDGFELVRKYGEIRSIESLTKLIDLVGQKNTYVSQEAWKYFSIQSSKYRKEEVPRELIDYLVSKIKDKNYHHKKYIPWIFYGFRGADLKLGPDQKRTLLTYRGEGKEWMATVLAFQNVQGAFQLLVQMLQKNLESNDGCKLSNTFIGIEKSISNGFKVPKNLKPLLLQAQKSKLFCGDSSVSEEAEQILERLA